MEDYVVRRHTENCSEIERSVRDAQFPEGVNTVTQTMLTDINGDADSEDLVQFFVYLKIESYPEYLPEKLTFYSHNEIIISDTNLLFEKNDPRAFEIWIDLYIRAFNKANKSFVEKLGSLPEEAIQIARTEETRQLASEIMDAYLNARKP